MNLYLISANEPSSYNTYDSAIVAAESEAIAKTIHPDGTIISEDKYDKYTWTSPSNVEVSYLGIAKESIRQQVILASFNAG